MQNLTQLHIDMARNATDDFNLFHDRHRWNWVKNNPFHGPIALGFQLGMYIESELKRSNEKPAQSFRFSTYEFNFANPARVDDKLSLDIKPPRISEKPEGELVSQRICLKVNGKPGLIGFYRLSNFATIVPEISEQTPSQLMQYTDKSFIEGDLFLKRKWMIVGNAKNFLLSAFADQTLFIDEFADKVSFPNMYPMSLISSALLERAQAKHYDLIGNPLIYVSQHLCIDNQQVQNLRSNDCLQMLVKEISDEGSNIVHLHCCAWVKQASPLFFASLKLSPLQSILAKSA
ncbi:hypothetical protein [Agaribacter flavus]|uniref:Uncharacterized protein n=1 Tax=Agaribacter flavus TaxID=1902781 RepID=A0ABV7FTI8_9ALTE